MTTPSFCYTFQEGPAAASGYCAARFLEASMQHMCHTLDCNVMENPYYRGGGSYAAACMSDPLQRSLEARLVKSVVIIRTSSHSIYMNRCVFVEGISGMQGLEVKCMMS